MISNCDGQLVRIHPILQEASRLMSALDKTLRGRFVPIGIRTDAQRQRKVTKMQNANTARNIKRMCAIQLSQSDSWSLHHLFASSPVTRFISLSLTPPLNNLNNRNSILDINGSVLRVAAGLFLCLRVLFLVKEVSLRAILFAEIGMDASRQSTNATYQGTCTVLSHLP